MERLNTNIYCASLNFRRLDKAALKALAQALLPRDEDISAE